MILGFDYKTIFTLRNKCSNVIWIFEKKNLKSVNRFCNKMQIE